MDGWDHTTYIMYLSYQLYLSMQILGGSYMCSCKAFHPSLSRASCFRGHLLHSNLSPLVTVPITPVFVHWRIHSGTCEQWHSLKTLALCSPEYVLHVPWRHLLQIIPEKCPFSIGATTQCLIRANHWDPQKGVRPLSLCPRTTLAPTKFGNDFWQMHTHMFFPFRSWSILREKSIW